MNVKILGTGRALPARVVDNEELAELCGLSSALITERSGVNSRHWVTDETASELGAQASGLALQAARLGAKDIDLIINASGTPPQVMPDGAALLQRELGQEWKGTPTFSVHSSCLSFLSALRVAAALISSGQARRILIVSTEVTSVALDFEQPESSILFGDGAAAVILGPSEGLSRIEKCSFQTFSEGADLTEIRGGGTLRHPQNPLTSAKDNLFQMSHRSILKLALKTLPPFLEEFEPGLSCGAETFDWLIPHQASKSGMELLKRLGWPEERTLSNLSTFGNTVAASIPLSMSVAIETQKIQRGDRLLMVATGAGFSLGAICLVY